MTANVKQVPIDKLNKYLEFYDKKNQLIVLRRYIHRDIFTTYSSCHKVPQSIIFKESYLIHRDDILINDNEAEQSLFNKLSIFQHSKQPSLNHNSINNTKRHTKHISVSFYEEDSESQSDAASSARDYSPPQSPGKTHKNEEKSSPIMLEKLLNHARSESEPFPSTNADSHVKPCQNKPSDSQYETHGVEIYKSVSDLDKRKSMPVATRLQNLPVPDLSWPKSTHKLMNHNVSSDSMDFDFLKPENEQENKNEFSRSCVPNYELQEKNPDTLTIRKKKHLSFEQTPGSNKLASSNGNSISPHTFRRSTSISPVITVDAGIPPKVPVHKRESLKKKPTWDASNQISSIEDCSASSQKMKSENQPAYTRKCSYRRPKVSVKTLPEEPKEQIDELAELETRSITLSSDVVSERRMFMLDGYKEESTRLHCLNPDKRIASISSLRSQVKARPQSYMDFLDQDNIWEGRAEAFAARLG